jgi:hypothetical protein
MDRTENDTSSNSSLPRECCYLATIRGIHRHTRRTILLLLRVFVVGWEVFTESLPSNEGRDALCEPLPSSDRKDALTDGRDL